MSALPTGLKPNREAVMRGLSLLRRSPVLVVTVAAVAIASAGIAVASIPDSSGVIHGCYNTGSNPSGTLRVIDSDKGATCSKNEKPLTWNQTGPKGDKGDPGPPGPSEMFGASDSSAQNVLSSSETLLTGAAVPAGDYAIQGKTELLNDTTDGRATSCELVDTAGDVLDTSGVDLTGEGVGADVETIPLQAAVALPSSTAVSLKCQTFSGSDGDVQAADTSLTLIKVGSIG
jgi:hypothetical protein